MALKFGGHVQLAHEVFMRSDDGDIGLCLLRQVSGRRGKVDAGSDGKAGVAVEAHADVFAVVVELPNLWDIRRIRHFAVLPEKVSSHFRPAYTSQMSTSRRKPLRAHHSGMVRWLPRSFLRDKEKVVELRGGINEEGNLGCGFPRNVCLIGLDGS